ncbi:MAG: DNA translocase FtsK, partial [Kiritimatiellae bacterium]|nr:DNA translocase FtsK [Kiritimatiellia bacterium]
KEEERAEKAAKRAQDKEAARLAREKAAEERDFERQQQERERRLRELQAAARAERLARLSQNSVPEPPPAAPEPVPVEKPVVTAASTPAAPVPKPETPPSAIEESVNPGDQEYPLPPIDLLDPIPGGTADHGDLQLTAQVIKDTLANFNVDIEVVGMRPGPVVTQYEIKPGSRIKIERIVNLSANLQMALAAKSLRIEAPIPGKQAVGIEVPNKRSMPVTFHQILMGSGWQAACEKMAVPLALGKDVAGNDLIYDLAKAPHLLVAGSTGSGKSVCLNSIITGLLMSRTPEELRLILVDPKRVEFTMYNDLPHLLVPVINDAKKVHFGLRWAIVEMNNRYKLLQKVKCRNIEAYNHRNDNKGDKPEVDGSGQQLLPGLQTYPEKLPYIVIIIDEVADIMASVGKEIEPAIAKLCALSRAVGIHLILATQRPSVDVITGTIKSNIPGRIAFKVSQANDSRTILDNPGAEELIGKGDMLFLKEGSTLMRAQGAYVSDDEIRRIVEFVKAHCKPCYDKVLCGKLDGIQEDADEDILDDDSGKPAADEGGGSGGGIAAAGSVDSEEEKNIQAAIEVIRMTNRASTSMLQRRLGFGYNKAARIMDALEERGIVGPSKGAGLREILKDLSKEIPDNEAIPGIEEEELSSLPEADGIPAADLPSEEDAELPAEDEV